MHARDDSAELNAEFTVGAERALVSTAGERCDRTCDRTGLASVRATTSTFRRWRSCCVGLATAVRCCCPRWWLQLGFLASESERTVLPGQSSWLRGYGLRRAVGAAGRVMTKCCLLVLRLSYSGKAVHKVFAISGQEAFLGATCPRSPCWAISRPGRFVMTT
jgi:hypothetical protein